MTDVLISALEDVITDLLHLCSECNAVHNCNCLSWLHDVLKSLSRPASICQLHMKRPQCVNLVGRC